jgi:hypothetical protein
MMMDFVEGVGGRDTYTCQDVPGMVSSLPFVSPTCRVPVMQQLWSAAVSGATPAPAPAPGAEAGAADLAASPQQVAFASPP